MKNVAIIIGSILGLTLIGAAIMAIVIYNRIDEEEFSRASVEDVVPISNETRLEIVS